MEKLYCIADVANMIGKDYGQVWNVVHRQLPELGIASQCGSNRLFSLADVETISLYFSRKSKNHFDHAEDARKAGGKYNARQVAEKLGVKLSDVLWATGKIVEPLQVGQNARFYTDANLVKLKTYFAQKEAEEKARPQQTLPVVDWDTLNDYVVKTRQSSNTIGHAIKSTRNTVTKESCQKAVDKLAEQLKKEKQ